MCWTTMLIKSLLLGIMGFAFQYLKNGRLEKGCIRFFFNALNNFVEPFPLIQWLVSSHSPHVMPISVNRKHASDQKGHRLSSPTPPQWMAFIFDKENWRVERKAKLGSVIPAIALESSRTEEKDCPSWIPAYKVAFRATELPIGKKVYMEILMQALVLSLFECSA